MLSEYQTASLCTNAELRVSVSSITPLNHVSRKELPKRALSSSTLPSVRHAFCKEESDIVCNSAK